MSDIAIPVSRENFFAIMDKHPYTVNNTKLFDHKLILYVWDDNQTMIGIEDGDKFYLNFP